VGHAGLTEQVSGLDRLLTNENHPVFSFAVLAATVYAQAPQPDFSKVEIKTTKISNTFYTLEGQGGTIGVLVGPDGIFMVDSQFAPLSQKIPSFLAMSSASGWRIHPPGPTALPVCPRLLPRFPS
jgi:hypothetical protein